MKTDKTKTNDDEIAEFARKTIEQFEQPFNLCEGIICNDGTEISVQASIHHYCSPRENNAKCYTHVEAGFPTVKPQESMMEYAECPDKPTETVYTCVPISIILEFINLHGGIKSGELSPHKE